MPELTGQNNSNQVRASFPIWGKIFICGGLALMIYLSYVFLVKIISDGPSFRNISGCLFATGISLIGLWEVYKVIFCSITTTEYGLVFNNLFSSQKTLPWNNIVEIRRSKLFRSSDITYIVSASNEKMILLRSMKGYVDIIKLIKDNAQNLIKCEP